MLVIIAMSLDKLSTLRGLVTQGMYVRAFLYSLLPYRGDGVSRIVTNKQGRAHVR